MAAAYGEVTSIIYSLENRFFLHAPAIINPLIAIPAAHEAKKLLRMVLESNTDMLLLTDYAKEAFSAMQNKQPFPRNNNIPSTTYRNTISLLERIKMVYKTGNRQILRAFSDHLKALDDAEEQPDSEYCTPKQEFIDALRRVALHYTKLTNTELRNSPAPLIAANTL